MMRSPDTYDETKILRVLAERELARRNLLDFTKLTYPRYRPGRFHRELSSILTRFARGEVTRLIVTAPPRAGKSRLVSCQLPAFLFGLHPGASIIAASHTHALAATVSREVKRIMYSPEYQRIFPDVKLVERGGDGTNTADEWNIEATRNTGGIGGTYKAAGVRAALSGRGMHFGIVDDPFRNREEAESQTIRDKVWEWWGSDFFTRAEGVAGVVVMHTRFHEDDLVGRLLHEGGWEIINFPAIEQDGASFWPEKFPLETLDDIRRRIGPKNWASLYMQEPSPSDGSVFQREWFQYYQWNGNQVVTPDGRQHDPHLWHRFATMDVAVTADTTGDWTVLAIWMRSPDQKLFLDHLIRVRCASPDLFPLIESARSKYGCTVVYMESNGVGLPLFQMAEAKKLPVREVNQHRDKVARAEATTPWFARGDILFPKDAPWLPRLEHELLAFPLGTWDDQVDVVSLAVQVSDIGIPTAMPIVGNSAAGMSRVNVHEMMSFPFDTPTRDRRDGPGGRQAIASRPARQYTW